MAEMAPEVRSNLERLCFDIAFLRLPIEEQGLLVRIHRSVEKRRKIKLSDQQFRELVAKLGMFLGG